MTLSGGWHRFRDRLAALSPRDRRAIVIGAVVLVPVLLWAGIVRPYLKALDDFSSRLAVEQALLQREREIVRNAADISARLETIRHQLDRMEMELVAAENPALAEAILSAHLEHLARANRVLLQEVRSITGSNPAAVADGTVPLYLSVSGESDFEGILALFNDIETDRLLMQISNLSLGPAPAGGGEGNGSRTDPHVQAMRFTAVVVSYMAEEKPAGGR